MSDTNDAVGSPPLDADPVILCDWLELVAFFDPSGLARLDEIDNSFSIQEEETAIDDASSDAEIDDRRSLIEEEIETRLHALGDSYPFELSGDGEVLIFKERGRRRGSCFYLSCLVISHVTRSPILLKAPADDETAKVRKRQFQVLATLAVAGHVGGPAVSIGWPRSSRETIVETLKRCCLLLGTGKAREVPGQEASRYAKDGGMDVIAYRPSLDSRPPPAEVVFGQAASGHNWAAKSSVDEIDQFMGGYFEERPACGAAGVTVVPFRLTNEEHRLHGRRHGHILDRLRTPKAAARGLRISCEDGVSVDEVSLVGSLNRWLLRYRRSIHAA